MTRLQRLALLARIVTWRLTWNRCPTDYCPAEANLDRRFMSAEDAVDLVPDGAVGISCGMAGNARCTVLFRALRNRFRASGRPRDLTWIAVGGQGGRGKAPGTVEELGEPGLVRRFVSGHVETAKSLLKLAGQGDLELHVLPQGEMTEALAAQAKGRSWADSRTGTGTFLDPRCGRGSPVAPAEAQNLVTVVGDRLRYHLPSVDLAFFNAPWADRKGNIYFRDAATITENREAARAAKANGGLVMAAVAGLVEARPDEADLPAEMIDAIVVDPRAEQTILSPQVRCWPMFTPGGDGNDHEACETLRFVNRVLSLTPRRGPVEQALARLGADTFARHVARPAHVNIGVGFGEEVCREIYESPLNEGVTFTTETGVYGGLPAPGIYFGAAVNPERLESSAWMFEFYKEHLDAALLGFLEFDAAGNVNVSRRGPEVTDYVGPGGFPSITHAARTVIFIGRWMHDATWEIQGQRLILQKPGRTKLVPEVHEVTFSGRQALADGKQVFYVTSAGVFRLTDSGLEIETVMPGVDLKKDILDTTEVDVRVPAGGPLVAPASVVTGREFVPGAQV
jgi:propionate CoA-transferase